MERLRGLGGEEKDRTEEWERLRGLGVGDRTEEEGIFVAGGRGRRYSKRSSRA